MKLSPMAKRRLEAKILKVVAQTNRSGKRLGASDLLSSKFEKEMQADSLSIREAIWHLLATHQLELTEERKLQPSSAEGSRLARAV